MSSPMAKEELKKFLQDVGMYEENMSENEMRSYYDAIKCSENTAKEEDQSRQHEDVELVEERDDVDHNVSEETETMDTSDNKTKEDIVVGNVILDPMNCKPSKFYKFHYKSQTLRYNLPPYLDPKFRCLSVEDRAKIISEFHLRQLEIFSEFHETLDIYAPKGKDFPCRFINTDDVFIEQMSESVEETYISRSGRHTRRKDYSEYETTQKTSSQCKREKRDKNFNCTPLTPRTQQIQKLTNEQIMQRSKFFSDSPKPTTSSGKSTSVEKKQEEEPITESPLKSSNTQEKKYNLNPAWLAQSEDVDDEVKAFDVEEFPVIRRRIPPPIRGRKGISKRSRSNLETETNETVQSQLLKPMLQVSPSVSAPNLQNSPPNSTNKKRRTRNTMMCPICSEYFKAEEVEAHASNCGLGMTNPVIFESASSTPKKMVRCDICDKEMVQNTDYEIHVTECLNRKRMK